MRISLAVVALFISFSMYSQSYDYDKILPKALKAYDKALVFLKDGDLKAAVPILLDCIQLDSNFLDAYLSLAGALGEMKQYQRAIQLYELVQQKDAAYFSIYQLPYSINLAGAGNFEKALSAIEHFETIPGLSERSRKSAAYRKKTYRFAIDYANKYPARQYTFLPINLGDSINSPQSEYYPSVTVTDSLLVFTRKTGYMREDFMQSKVFPGHFGTAAPVNGDINIEPLKGAITVSQDGEWLLFAGDFSGQGMGNFDIYQSYYTPQGWSEPENMGPAINTEFWESSPTLSPDKRALYFSSNRPGGMGGKDLYVSYRQSNGRWSSAINMGSHINSIGDELAPFIHADNQTLYYTSDGLPGYGSSDLFVTRKTAKGEWDNPLNLGYPINTIENEGSLAVAADGLTAYYASDRSDSRGGLDLYRFNLRDDIRPYRTLYVKGKVIDQKTKKGIPAAVELTDNATSQILMKVQTDELGDYFITLPTGKDYTFTVNRKGYLFYSELYELNNKSADSTYTKNIPLWPIEVNASFIFQNIRFASNAYVLPEGSSIELDRLIQLLIDNPSLKVEVSGHTDNVGKPEDNLLLSTRRAQSIADYLIQKGIATERIAYKGYGATQPIADNASENGRSLNRRTSFTVTAL